MENGTMYGITRVPGVCGGKPIIDGLRVRVQDVVICHQKEGMTPEEIREGFPILTLSQVYAALAYYFQHREEIDADIDSEDQFAEEFRKQHPDSVR